MWWLCVLSLTAYMLVASWRAGPQFGLGSTVVLSLLVPTWIIEVVAGFPVHVRFAVTVAALGVYCLHPKSKVSFRLTWIDLAGLALIVVHLVSDWSNEGFNWFVPLRAYGEWFVPYIAGRLAIQSLDDVRQVLPVAGGVAVLLAIGGISESLLRFDVWPAVFGPPPVNAPPPLDTLRPDVFRWGLRRASGPTMNPNFFGLLQLLLLPWTMYAAVRASRGRAAGWWAAAPFLCAVGVVSPLSRSAHAGLLILLFVQLFLMWPRTRPILLGAVIAVVVAVSLYPAASLSALRAWGEETAPRKPRVITVDGERVQASDALYRVHLLFVYRTAAERAGPFGFGTEAVTGFPVNVPLGAVDNQTKRYLRFVDNAYLLLVLRFGYVGLICFTAFGVAAAGTFIWMARDPAVQGQAFFAAAAGALTAVLLMLLTVWMPQDFGFCLLWTAGIASGLRLHGHGAGKTRAIQQPFGDGSQRLSGRRAP